ncbi:hypothetical protein [Nostoc sp.]|uniref:hypothetical protein n=1 Tax=Nostoc sp. TaxID=1180 RepID=UPI002FFB979A
MKNMELKQERNIQDLGNWHKALAGRQGQTHLNMTDLRGGSVRDANQAISICIIN